MLYDKERHYFIYNLEQAKYLINSNAPVIDIVYSKNFNKVYFVFEKSNQLINKLMENWRSKN